MTHPTPYTPKPTQQPQPGTIPEMPTQQPPMPGMPEIPEMPGVFQQNFRQGAFNRQTLLPKWMTQHSAVVYIIALLVVSFMYSAYGLPWYYMMSGIVTIVVFFFYGPYLANKRLSIFNIRRQRSFEKKIFLIAFILRVIWMFLIYYIFMQSYGNAFGFESGDADFYHKIGEDFATAIKQGEFFNFWEKESDIIDISDMGYGAYVGFIYWLTGTIGVDSGPGLESNNIGIIAVRLFKCLWSALTVLLIYRLAKRNFGEQTGRVAAIFCALWPNFWYYCGCHLKETEMVFLGVLFVEQADQMLRSRQFTTWKVVPILLIGASIFTFRTPLALVAFLALIFSVVMSSSKVVNWGKRIIVGGLAVLLIGVTMGNRIEEESRSLLEQARGEGQHENMEWRARREHGNAFAKYAGKSVFAPLIFTIPFPSMVRPFDGQDQQQLLNGGNFIKNIISFFTLLAMVILIRSGEWRDHLLPLSFLLGYLVVLVMSAYAQSERFHQPVMPFELMFAAYGLSIALMEKKYKRWFTYWCMLMFVACVAWNWFKMAGRGL